jgi:hypothetical protein
MPLLLLIDEHESELILYEYMEALIRRGYMTYLDTSHSVLQFAVIPLCVGASTGGAVVLGGPAVRVVGVPGTPTHKYRSSVKPAQLEATLGFHLTRSSFENRPNMPTISSHVSSSPASYHKVQVLICPWEIELGRCVTVAGAGRESPAATQ